MLRAASPVNSPRLLAGSAATGMAVTGTVNETALATISIPAGAMGLSGGLHVHTTWSYTNSANAKTLRVRLGGIGGTAHMSAATTTTVSFIDFRRIRNRGVANSQVGVPTGTAPFGAITSAPVTSAIDTSVAVDLVISGQLASAGETITLESYEVWLVP